MRSFRDEKKGTKGSPASPESEKSVSDGTASPETSHVVPPVMK